MVDEMRGAAARTRVGRGNMGEVRLDCAEVGERGVVMELAEAGGENDGEKDEDGSDRLGDAISCSGHCWKAVSGQV